jgi:hypothetical protein
MIKTTRHTNSLTTTEYSRHFTESKIEDRDNHTHVIARSCVTEDGEIINTHFQAQTYHSVVFHQNDNGYVAVYPSHPRYHEYDFPEVEVEPSLSDEPAILGKIIANWDIKEVFVINKTQPGIIWSKE